MPMQATAAAHGMTREVAGKLSSGWPNLASAGAFGGGGEGTERQSGGRRVDPWAWQGSRNAILQLCQMQPPHPIPGPCTP